MDREKFKAHAETLRMSSYRIILACKGGYWDAFCEFLLDCSDAFQATRTDDVPIEEQVPLYCWPAPGFEQRTESGERLVCKVHVAMQGRIDATLLFNTKLFDLLVLRAGMTRLMTRRSRMPNRRAYMPRRALSRGFRTMTMWWCQTLRMKTTRR